MTIWSVIKAEHSWPVAEFPSPAVPASYPAAQTIYELRSLGE